MIVSFEFWERWHEKIKLCEFTVARRDKLLTISMAYQAVQTKEQAFHK